MDPSLDRYDIEVELTLLPAEDGGRRFPIYPGYRAAHICLDDEEWIAAYEPKDRPELHPGETGRVHVVFFFEPQYLVGRLWVGREFLLIEGAKTIGSGRITAMLTFDVHVGEYLQRKARRDTK
jgi:translation elongation factor EF-Tu-like GTPase